MWADGRKLKGLIRRREAEAVGKAGPANGGVAFEAEERSDGIVGLIAISQTCDIVRRTAD